MDQNIDYAEMLEIPVSTLNVVKRGKKRGGKDLREKVIKQVNSDIEREDAAAADSEGATAAEEPARTAESTVIEGRVKAEKRMPKILIVEFACACLLCTTIFMTNIFMSDSAMNKLISGAAGSDSSSSTSDERTYLDFSLSSIVSERADVEKEISSAGVLTFTGECSVYPACDGKVLSVSLSDDGLYTVSISHSDSFESVMTGLTSVYYAEGEEVKGNIPIGYTDGGAAVSVMMYSDDALLNCYTLNDDSCLVWKS